MNEEEIHIKWKKILRGISVEDSIRCEGFNEDFNPKFLKKYAQMGKMVREAVTAYNDEVKSGEYPTLENSFSE